MSKRGRHFLVTAITVALTFAYLRVAGDARDVDYYVGLAGVIVLIGAAGVPFVELPKDPYPRLRRSRG